MARAEPAAAGSPALGLFPVALIALLAAPVLAGLAGVALPAFGWLPALGGERLSLGAFAALAERPGIARSALLSLWTGLGSALLAFVATVLFVAGFAGTRTFSVLRGLISPLLSLPHAAAAIGLAFLVSPSGWLIRLASPWATGWTRPPDLLVINDPAGTALLLGLAAKEVPFLMLMTLAALGRGGGAATAMVTASLGYGRVTGFLLAVLPRLYPQIRLPIFAVIAYATSTVDMALVLGPTTPPTLAVALVRLAADPDLAVRFEASAAALLQLGVTASALAIWMLGERAAAMLARRAARRGRRDHFDNALAAAGLAGTGLAAAAVGAGLVSLGLWSVAEQWRFPAGLPDSVSLERWSAALPELVATVGTTAALAAASTAIALVLVLGSLEAAERRGSKGLAGAGLIYLPLLVPQVAFLFGLQVLLLAAGVTPGLAPVLLAHLVFVVPYVALSLEDPWQAFDRRYARAAAALGASPARIFWRIRLPLLARPVATAAAVGFAVSVGVYLPTLLAGGGRVVTLTTEAVARAGGSDRRTLAIYALAQTLLPFAGFVAAALLPRLVHRGQRAAGGVR
ncbi:ABC transporter permease [Methylobrevis albus]|uniref:ABC transporter permease subunit n=1 Tax=Methylobrevis albus TaxID=2793297 RepID=A0A931I1P4_9HYPH|nr:ABC transporter permease subunit [Methylobrevis albus]MBH0238590.1 ABC transporter permease subunit [Methylobrevis albus]